MKVKDIDFKALKEENSKKLVSIILTVWELTKSDSKYFSSFTGLYNYITSHPRASEYLNSECEYTIQSTWNQHAQMEQATYEFRILLPKMDTGKVPYDKAYKHIPSKIPGIKDVIFNPPATIVFWEDRTKTVVKAQEDFDPEKGLAMAISKKMFGNNYGYYNVFQKWLKKWDKQSESNDSTMSKLSEAVEKLRLAFAPSVSSTAHEILERKCATLEKLTGLYFDDLIEDLVAGDLQILAAAKNENSISDLSEACDKTYCKNCQYFVPANELDKTHYPNPLDADGACLGTPEIKYVDAFDTCDEGDKKIDEDK